MRVEIEIPYKLHSYNELRGYGTQGHTRKIIRLKGEWQQQYFVAMRANVNWLKLERLLLYDGLITFSIIYHQARPFDQDNAMSGANKLIIDPLVRKGILPDDTPKYIKLGTAIFVKCRKGNEKVIAIFETGEE
jgi:hypothetical protein